MRVKLEIDLSSLERKLTSTVESLDLSGLGTDGASEYRVVDFSLIGPVGPVTLILDVEHVEGKFASKEELADVINGIIQEDL